MGRDVSLSCFFESGKGYLRYVGKWKILGGSYWGQGDVLIRLRILFATSICPELSFGVDVKDGGLNGLKIVEVWWVGSGGERDCRRWGECDSGVGFRQGNNSATLGRRKNVWGRRLNWG